MGELSDLILGKPISEHDPADMLGISGQSWLINSVPGVIKEGMNKPNEYAEGDTLQASIKHHHEEFSHHLSLLANFANALNYYWRLSVWEEPDPRTTRVRIERNSRKWDGPAPFSDLVNWRDSSQDDTTQGLGPLKLGPPF